MSELPRILIIDDVFGRMVRGGNRERASLCGMYRLKDLTPGEDPGLRERILNPLAEAVFFRGQTPACAVIGDWVENDLEATVAMARVGWKRATGECSPWALVLLDLCFYTGEVTDQSNRELTGFPVGRSIDDHPTSYFGLAILERLHQEAPEVPVVILSSKQRDEVSHAFSSHGALGFLPRSDSKSPERLKQFLWRHGLTPDSGGGMIGHSLPLLLALRAARRASENRRNILIRGERGVGKELLAAYINQSASDSTVHPFVAVDSGTLSPALYASELFGHVRGAFTGAERERIGRIVQADKGDLFLDEIGNLPPDVQSGLLRVLETRIVTPLGSSQSRTVDVRFLAATNEDIELKSASGSGFRPDLLDRLREGGTVVLPPLRDRPEDIPQLAEHFIRQAEREHPGALKRTLTGEAIHALVNEPWLGNIRELRNCLRKAVFNYSDVEYVVPGHLGLASSPPQLRAPIGKPETLGPETGSSASLSEGIGQPKGATTSLIAASLERLEARFHSDLAGIVEDALNAYTDPITGRINFTGAYRLLAPSEANASNTSANAKRWFRKLFERSSGLIRPLPEEVIAGSPMLVIARRWAMGSKLKVEP